MNDLSFACRLAALFVLTCTSFSKAETYPEVLFENSETPNSYYYSNVSYQGKSFVRNIDGHLPVVDTLFFTPGNALVLQYVSAANSAWNASISYRSSRYYTAKGSDFLVFKVRFLSGAGKELLPSIGLIQQDSVLHRLPLSGYVEVNEEEEWVAVRIPLKDFEGFDADLPIEGVSFGQWGSGEGEHRLFVDQVEFLSEKTPQMRLTGKAMLTRIDPAEFHVDLYWQLPLTPSLRYVKIYRSENNKDFVPIGVSSTLYRKFTDIVPVTNRTYYYKIVWMDYQYRESPSSDVLKADVQRGDDEQLLTKVQKAHIDYFIDNGEINSGMFRMSTLPSDPRVSVKATGVGILALIVGAEREFIARNVLLDRLLKITRFLQKADHFNGVYPEVLNGRNGKVVATDSCEVAADLEATAFLIQGLLVARSYFDQDNAEETNFREMATALWKQVNWRSFNGEENQGLYLYDKWSPLCQWEVAHPMAGYNTSFVPYLLAIASPIEAFSMEPEAYSHAWRQQLTYRGPLETGARSPIGRARPASTYVLEDTLITDVLIDQDYVYAKEPFFNGDTYMGVVLPVGSPDSSLLAMQPSFMAFDPREKRDSTVNYFDNQRRLATIQYRLASSQNEHYVGLTGVLWGEMKRDSLSSIYVPAAAISSYPYLKHEVMDVIYNYYRQLGHLLWTEYGFRDSFDLQANWVSNDFDPVRQAIIPVMIENGRTGLIWNLFMRDPDIKRTTEELFGNPDVD